MAAEPSDYFLREVESEISNTVRRNQRRISRYNDAARAAANAPTSSGVPRAISPTDWDWDEEVTSSTTEEASPTFSGDFSGLSDLRPTTSTGSSRVRAHQFIPQKDDWDEISNPMEMYGDLYIRFQRAAKSGATAGKDLYYFGEMTLGQYVSFKNSASLGKAINELGDDYSWDIGNPPPDLVI